MKSNSKIYIAGENGMVGRAIEKELLKNGYDNIIGPSSKELNLIEQSSVESFFVEKRPEYVFLCAARVGGIQANISYKGDFLYENLMIECNIIRCALKYNVKRLIFISSGCVYPKFAKNPISEDDLLTGSLEPSNEHYAIAKIAGLKLCEAYHEQYGFSYGVVVPCNVYGLYDNFNPLTSHVMAALVRKFHEAKKSNTKEVEVWGSGNQRREFIFSQDLAELCIFLMNNIDVNTTINAGAGTDLSIKELCQVIASVIDPENEIKINFNPNKPEGHFQKLFDISKAKTIFKWQPKTNIKDGA
ncbi:GDP-L-fucose synthase, partial [bacterium]|nr:GDP-L-fucose synthase [bacterium]